MQHDVKRIGISGGTFDPIHNGHLIIAEEIREAMNLDKVLFIPTGTPPHKDALNVTDMEHRYNMVMKAVCTNKHFEVSRIDMERAGYTYTEDTLTDLKKIYGEDTKLYFIIGADIIYDLVKWHNFRNVFALCEFAACMRPGYDRDSFLRKIDELQRLYGAVIHICDVPLVDISSTMIRDRLRKHKSIKYLVPESVEEYIYENGLYCGEYEK